MASETNTAAALLSALRLAREHGSAGAALRSNGIDMRETERFAGLTAEVDELVGHSSVDPSVGEALALGFLAGRSVIRPRLRTPGDPTAFVMDRELVVRDADGESILRLPWFEDGLFVGRQLPDICEMPSAVRKLCVLNYSTALAGKVSRFAFTSYGHSYSVDAVPVRGDSGGVTAVLAVAMPSTQFAAAAAAFERTAERLENTAALADQRADLHGRVGRGEHELEERRAAEKARNSAGKSRLNAQRLRSRDADPRRAEVPAITPRETEVLQLASHGLTHIAIAEQLSLSPATVKTHLENVYPKLGVADKAAAVASALRHGLIE